MSKPQSMCPVANGSPGDACLCPLSRVVAGTPVRIKRLNARPGVSNRVREIGLGEDRRIKVLCCQSNFICLVCNARFGISSQLADSILVEPLNAQQPAA